MQSVGIRDNILEDPGLRPQCLAKHLNMWFTVSMLVFAFIEGLSLAVDCLSAWVLAVLLDQAPEGSAAVPYSSSPVNQELCVPLRANPNTSGVITFLGGPAVIC